jgi:hypothetical protein
MKPMQSETAGARILDALSAQGAPLCDDCLPNAASLSTRQQANAECRKLASSCFIQRGSGTCSVCGGGKQVNSASPTAAQATATPPPLPKKAPPQAALGSVQRSVEGLLFRYVQVLKPECDAGGSVREYQPHLKYSQTADSVLNKYGVGPFCRFRVPKGLTYEGVYLLTAGDEILYVGKCDNLAVRFNLGYGQISPRNCYKGGQPTNCKINGRVLSEVEHGRQIDLWFLATPNPLVIEKQLIKALSPPWNGQC